jgi:Ca2+-transporting ATPase
MPGREWGISIALGFVSIPLGALIRLIPNGPCEKFFILLRLRPRPGSDLPTASPAHNGEKAKWNYAIDAVNDNLGAFSNIRGGRMRGSSFVQRSRTGEPGSDDEKMMTKPNM